MIAELALESAIRLELIKQAVSICWFYLSCDEFTAKEAQIELEHYHRQVMDWSLGKELPGWAKD